MEAPMRKMLFFAESGLIADYFMATFVELRFHLTEFGLCQQFVGESADGVEWLSVQGPFLLRLWSLLWRKQRIWSFLEDVEIFSLFLL